MSNEMTGDTSNRTLCETLEDMRGCLKTLNFSYLNGLIEEAQYRANRMENAIEKYGGWQGVRDMEKNRIQLRDEIKKLQDKRDKLKREVDNMEEE